MKLLHPVANPGGLFALVPGTEKLDRLAGGFFRPKRFILAAFVVGDYLIGGVQNIGRTAVILLQFDHRCVREVLLEIENVPDIRVTEPVNRLILVSDDGQAAEAVRLLADAFAKLDQALAMCREYALQQQLPDTDVNVAVPKPLAV